MATLKGQNFRICIYDTTAQKFKVIGMATNCSVSLQNNTEDATTKDDVGMSSRPTSVSKSWSVSVDSLNVADMAAILSTIKAMNTMVVMWDETSTTDNQALVSGTAFARGGNAYLTDCTFQFDDRTNATKQLQFTGTGALQPIDAADTTQYVARGSYTKGQFVRLFLSDDNSAAPSKVIAAARTLSLHCSVTVENATTKDTTGTWQVQEPTGFSYDISSGALVRSGDVITSSVPSKGLSDLETIYESGNPVKWKIANTEGYNNRTATTTIVSGSVVLTQLSINGPNRQNADYTAQMQGYGEYTVASTPPESSSNI